MEARGAGHVGWRVHLHHGCRVVFFLSFFLFSNSVGAAQGLCGRVTIRCGFLASGVRFVEELVAQRWGSGNGRSEVWCFLKTSSSLLAILIIHAMSLLLAHRLTSFIHVLYPSWVSFDPSHFVDVIRSLEVVEGIVGRRRCARAQLVVQLRERSSYTRLIIRGIVSFNFSPSNSTLVAIAP